jgi:serine/threonine-protein kinase SRPK3
MELEGQARSSGFPTNCLHLYDAFLANSYHGPLMCSVTNILGESLISLQEEQPNGKGAFSVALSKRIIKKILLAHGYPHREYYDIVFFLLHFM